MSMLKDHLCLTRPNFQINPKQAFDDAKLFFGEQRNAEIIGNMEMGYMAGYVPRMYLFGGYGTGKTHLLYHLKYHFETSDGPVQVLPFVVQAEAESKTRFQALHKRMMDALSLARLEKVYMDYNLSLGDEREKKLRELFSDENLFQAMRLLPTGPANKTLAWRWLTGEKLSVKDQTDLGVTSNLTETGDLVRVLAVVGELFKRSGQHLLFLVDESEALHVVSQHDAQRSWHDAFRRLADSNDNQSVGWVLSFYTTMQDEPPGFMTEGDIMTRLGREGIRLLEPLAPVEVAKFLTDLLGAFVDREAAAAKIQAEGLETTAELYPFTDDGLSVFVQHASVDPHNSIPRTILGALTACALETLRSGRHVFDAALVDDVVPAEFADVT